MEDLKKIMKKYLHPPKSNPSSGAKQRAHGVRKYKHSGAIPGEGMHEMAMQSAALMRRTAPRHPQVDWARLHAEALETAKKHRPKLPNPTDEYMRGRMVEIAFSDGSKITTQINGTRADVTEYYVGRTFNVAHGENDRMLKATAVKFLDTKTTNPERDTMFLVKKGGKFTHVATTRAEATACAKRTGGAVFIAESAGESDREHRALGKKLANPARRAPRAAAPADEQAATELAIYINNDGGLYRQQYMPIVENLRKKIKKGTYDRAKAVKLVMYLAENGAKKYAKELDEASRWAQLFSVPTRLAASDEILAGMEEGYLFGR